jgi:predicted transcriptional regulator
MHRMQDNECMQNPKGSSIRVSSVIRRRVGSLARRLKASSQEEVIDQALDALERAMFWQGFDSEVEAYLNKNPQELAERDTFGQVSGDGMRPKR